MAEVGAGGPAGMLLSCSSWEGGLARASEVCGGGLGVVEDWRELGGLEAYLEVDGGEDGHHNVHLESGV